MIATYNPLLIALSILIAIIGAYSGLQLARRLDAFHGAQRKVFLAAAALTIGGGIWSMHFIGMLALQLPITVNYDVLLTLISALVSILVTGLGLYFASSGQPTVNRILLAGLFMGLGISSMHYIGMAAVRANCVISYGFELVAASVLVGIAASTLALWLAFRRKTIWQTLAAAVVQGLAISGMHYTAMAAATFLPVDLLLAYAAPALSPYLMAIVIAIAAFLLFGFALLMALPERLEDAEAPLPEPAAGLDDRPETASLLKVPVVKNKTTFLLDPGEIVSIQAESHYTRVFDGRQSFFCSHSLSELEARLDPAVFLRVHRSHIVNLRHARAFERRQEQGVIRVDGADRPGIPVSRRNVPRLRAALGLPS